TSYAYPARVVDPEGDALTFTLQAGPAGVVIDRTGGLVTWTPAANQSGPQAIAILVDDGQGNVASQHFTVVVATAAGAPGVANHPPAIVSTPGLVALAGRAYEYSVQASDPDGDTPTFSLSTHPDGMTIDQATGLVNWIPSLAQLGLQVVTVIANDP